MEVDLPRFRTLEPQVYEVTQGPPLAKGQGFLVAMATGFPLDGDGERSLPEEGLMASRHLSQVIHHHKHLYHSLVWVE